ncbi:MAG: transcriptional regulator, Cro/CI family [Parcubacteria bacterium C7867-001]|nr:MAG: transcriptional regulator, Cro/CI family [Parcubacteria bacterium C7867-001]
MADPLDVYMGKRLRRRRRLLNMTQDDLARSIGIQFQQIQKYESAANRLTAARVYYLGKSLGVTVNYFTDFFEQTASMDLAEERRHGVFVAQSEVLMQKFESLSEEDRLKLIAIATALSAET